MTRFRRTTRASPAPRRFDEAFLRRLERLTLHAERTLRGRPGGEHPSARALPSAEFTQHRAYVPGDDPRYVDWAVYARSDEHFIRLGETPQDVRVHLLLDHSASMAWAGEATALTKLDAAAQLAALLGHVALAAGDMVRVVPVAERAAPPIFGPASGKARSNELLRSLAALGAAHGTTLGAALHDYAIARGDHGGLLVLLSDLWTLEPAALDTALRLLRPPRWQLLILHLLDPAELAPPPLGPIELEDVESGQRVTVTLDAATIGAYALHLQQWQAALRATCARAAATYLPISSDWEIDRVVVPFLQKRRLLR